MSDGTGALALPSALPKADWSIADRGCDADRFREARLDRDIEPCLPGRKSRDRPLERDRRRHTRRHRIEMMAGRPKDRRRAATRHDRRPTAFLSAIAAAVPVRPWVLSLDLPAL